MSYRANDLIDQMELEQMAIEQMEIEQMSVAPLLSTHCNVRFLQLFQILE